MKNIVIDGVEYAPVIKQTQIVNKHYHFELHPDNLGRMTWDEANKAVKALGDDWRLPTIEECFMIYNNKLISKDAHWSSSEFGNSSAWYFAFSIGYAVNNIKDYTYYVRAVRTIKQD